MEETKESVTTRVKNVLSRNKKQIGLFALGMGVGAVATSLKTGVNSTNFIAKVNKAIADDGKYVVESVDAPWTITATK